MAISTTLAVNTSVSLAYGSLSLAAATKTSSAACGSSGGASFQALPTIVESAFTSYTTLGPITTTTPFLLYVENYDSTADYYVFTCGFTPEFSVSGLVMANSTAYDPNDVVLDAGVWYRCFSGYTSGSPYTACASETTCWQPIQDPIFVPYGRAVSLWCTGKVHLIAKTAPTSGECKVLAIQDA